MSPSTKRRGNRDHNGTTRCDNVDSQLDSSARIRRFAACATYDGNIVFSCRRNCLTITDEITFTCTGMRHNRNGGDTGNAC